MGNRLTQNSAPAPLYPASNISFTYNNRNRMASATASGTTSYVYNALGQRIQKSGPGGTVLFAYDEAGHLLGEYTAAGALIQETIWLGDTPVATLRPNGGGGVNLYYVHVDHLNTPRTVTRPSDNAIVWRWDGDPFGVSQPNQNPAGIGAFSYNLRFPGQYYDAETGLSYNYFRDYDPQVGRYVESDPIGLRGGANTYAYVSSSPAMLADPIGLLSLGWSETWSDVNDLGGRKRGGYTQGFIKNVKCNCTGSGSCWTLGECSALLHVKVQILASASGAEEKFYRKSEAEHVADFRAGFGQILGAGKAAENSIRGTQFTSQAACEARAIEVVSAALQSAANGVAMASGKTYDQGRHTWQWWWSIFK